MSLLQPRPHTAWHLRAADSLLQPSHSQKVLELSSASPRATGCRVGARSGLRLRKRCEAKISTCIGPCRLRRFRAPYARVCLYSVRMLGLLQSRGPKTHVSSGSALNLPLWCWLMGTYLCVSFCPQELRLEASSGGLSSLKCRTERRAPRKECPACQ